VSARGLGRLASAAVVLAVLAGASAASAQSANTAFTQVRAVDGLDPAANAATYIATGANGGSPTLTVNDANVDATKTGPMPDTRPIGNALVFDTSAPMDTSGALTSAKEAARTWIKSRTGNRVTTEQFAIYTAGETGEQVQPFTSDQSLLIGALDRVGPTSNEAGRSKTALWAAVNLAAAALNSQSTLQPNLIVMAGQHDNASGSSRAAAVGEVASSRATVFGVAYTGNGYDAGQPKSLAGTYGGEVLTVADGTQFGTNVAAVAATIQTQQYVVSFASPVPVNAVTDLTISVGDQTTKAAYTSGSAVIGYQNLNPAVRSSSSTGVAFLQGGFGLALAILLVLVATALAAYAIFLLITRDSHLKAVLQPYSEGYGQTGDELESADDGSYAKTAIIQRAVAATEVFAESQGYLSRAEAALERANLPLRAGEALFFYAAVVVIATILGLAFGSLFTALIFGGVVAILPPAVVSFIAGRRRKKFLGQLPDTLQLLSGTLRAGYSLMQGVEAVSQEVQDPMGQELRRVVTESRLGRPLEESLDGTAERMDSPDFSWAVMAIRIQREVGGNLSELLMTVADTMTQRERLRRDVASLTAEGRMSAIVLGLLPVGLGIVMYLMNPEYMSKLFTDSLGNILLGGAIVAMIVGFLWMKKIIDIEI
jgi:tight adherence protein B